MCITFAYQIFALYFLFFPVMVRGQMGKKKQKNSIILLVVTYPIFRHISIFTSILYMNVSFWDVSGKICDPGYTFPAISCVNVCGYDSIFVLTAVLHAKSRTTVCSNRTVL